MARAPWCRFAALWICCCLASGVLPGQALFIKVFADAGVYKSACVGSKDSYPCKNQYLALSGIMQTGSLMAVFFLGPIGMLYDRLGARGVGTFGAALCGVGMLLITTAVWGSSAGYDDITCYAFMAGVFICDFGAMLNSFSFFGLIWHFPGKQSLIISFINCTYHVSALTPLVVNVLLRYTSFFRIMVVYTVVVFLTVGVCWILVPTQEEFYREAKRVLGIPLPRPKLAGVCEMLQRAWRVLRMNYRDHVVSGITLAVAFALPTFYSSLAVPYGEALFGDKDAGNQLASLYVSLTAIIGASLAPVAGSTADCMGLTNFIIGLGGVILTATLGCGLASWWAQTVTCACLVLFNCVFTLFISRYLLQYAPPNRFGTVQGLYCMLQMPGSILLVALMMVFYSMLGESANAYRIPMWIAGSIGSFFLWDYAYYFHKNPPPEVPQLLPDDEAELANGFGCTTIEEVMEVVNIGTRKELLKIMASNSPEDMHKLISSIDMGKMMEVLSRQSADQMADMMEQFEADEDEEPAAANYSQDPDAMQTDPLLGLNTPRDPEKGIEMVANGRWPPTGDGRQPELGQVRSDVTPVPDSHVVEDRASANEYTTGRMDINENGVAEGADASAEEIHSREATSVCPTEPPEEDPAVSKARDLLRMVREKDKKGFIDYCMNEPVDSMMKVDDAMRAMMTPAEYKQIDKDLQKVVTGKEWANLLRKRADLRKFVQRMVKKDFESKIRSSTRKLAGSS